MTATQASDSDLAEVLAKIEKQHGKGTVWRLDSDDRVAVETIPSGSIGLDGALGIGGWPRGRICEVYGPEASGKTTMTLHAIANAQKLGFLAGFVDAEHALDPEYAKALGVDESKIYVSQPGSGEQALDVAEDLIRSGKFAIVVIDSVAALVPQKEIDGEMGDTHIGLQARLMSQALRKLTGAASVSNTTVIFINQIRDKVGVFFGSSETTSGGRALKFYASVRLDVRAVETLKDGAEIIGKRTRAKVVKNKLSAPFRQVEFDILFGTGINQAGELLDLGVLYKVLLKTGSHYNYNGVALGNGREAARKYLREHADIADQVERDIRLTGLVGLQGASQPTPAPAQPDRSQLVGIDEIAGEPAPDS